MRFRDDEISLREILFKLYKWVKVLRSNWLKLLISGLVGGVLGFIYQANKKIIYKADLVFVTVEPDKGSLGKLSSLGSQFGFDFGGGNSGAFGGDNLLELMKSRQLVEQTLFDSLIYNGVSYRLLEFYLRRDSMDTSKTPKVDLNNIVRREDCGFRQDSLLKVVYKRICEKNLNIVSQDKDLAFKRVTFTDLDPVFAKNFVERLTDNVTNYYLETKTRQSRANIRMLELKADSVGRVLQSKMLSAALQRDQNQFLTNSTGAVSMVKQQIEVQLLTTMYGEVVKNLELSKTMAAMSEPLIQIIDRPRFPLEDDSDRKLLYLFFGCLFGWFFMGVIIIIKEIIK